MKELLLFLCLCISCYSATWNVKPTGGDYTLLSTAVAAKAEGDTFIVNYGGNGVLTETAKCNIKRRQVVLLPYSDTIKVVNNDYFVPQGDTVTVRGGYVMYDTTTATSYRYLFKYNSFGGHVIDGVSFDLGTNNTNGYKAAITPMRSSSSIEIERSYITRCNFYNKARITASNTIIAPNVTILYCKFFGGGLRAYTHWEIGYCYSRTTTDEFTISGDSGYVHHVYINGGNNTAIEQTSTDDASGSTKIGLKGWRFDYIIIDSVGHNDFVVDGLDSSVISNYVRVRPYSGTAIGPFYIHTSYNSDSVHCLTIRNCFLTGYPYIFNTSNSTVGNSDWLIFKDNVFASTGTFTGTYVTNDTITGALWSATAPSVVSPSYAVDTLKGRVLKSFFIDTIQYPFLRGNIDSTTNNAFINGRWMGREAVYRHLIKSASSSGDSIVLIDSLSSEYWFDDPINKDTANITIQYRLSGGAWSSAGTVNSVPAGNRTTFTLRDLANGTYDVRTVASGEGIADTTRTYSFTINQSQSKNAKKSRFGFGFGF